MWARNALTAAVCPSVSLSVPCLTLSRGREGTAGWKLAGRKPMTPMIHDPFRVQKVKGQGHQADQRRDRKNSHIFGTGRSTNFKLGISMDDDDGHQRPMCAVTCKLNALAGCSSHHLQGPGDILRRSRYSRTACYIESSLVQFCAPNNTSTCCHKL